MLYDDNFWIAYIEQLSTDNIDDEGRDKGAFQDNGKDYINYYVKASEIISICYYESRKPIVDETRILIAEGIMDSLMGTFHSYGKFPRPAYKELSYGWVSSMDAPTVGLAAQMLYEITGDPTYQQFVLELIPYMMKSADKGGYNLPTTQWPIEYAWSDVNDDTAWYVLNGSLEGYVATKALSSIYPDNALSEYLNCVERAYFDKFPEFHKGNEWSYYMLNSKAIIPIHYMIFEEKLFSAATCVSDNALFEVERLYREDCLKKCLNVEFYECGEGKYEYVLLRACSPHYYQIDTYTTRIEFLDGNGNVIFTQDVNDSGTMSDRQDFFYDTMFCHGYIDKKPSNYRVYSINGDIPFMLFETDVQEETVLRKKLTMNKVLHMMLMKWKA